MRRPSKPFKPDYDKIKYDKRNIYKKSLSSTNSIWEYFERSYCLIYLKNGDVKRGYLHKIFPASVHIGIIDENLQVLENIEIEKVDIAYAKHDVESIKQKIYKGQISAYNKRVQAMKKRKKHHKRNQSSNKSKNNE
ncbi:hypothetical protein [Staphylococcus pasteuri]|uniref:hypothetical protein n=1 Tax=Staphylococcus pasteuri TaxID=45972 RepID=UPI0010B50312|nr:hypothetical protein [Staphylococcus pasteuri]EAC3257009.1 hypothetical protein [Listeria monocytogenes]